MTFYAQSAPPIELLALREQLVASCVLPGDYRVVDLALADPALMPMWMFQAVHNSLMDMQVQQQRGAGNSPGFGERLRLLKNLVDRAPWIVDPDMGVMPREQAATDFPADTSSAALAAQRRTHP